MNGTGGFISDENREILQSASGSEGPLCSSSSKSPRSTQVHGKGSPISHDRQSRSPIDGRPKKGGCGGKGTWGGLMDTYSSYPLDSKDPNYDSSEEECEHPNARKSAPNFDAYKRK
ncbi:MA3 DOMAIN-CONTAINING TRANSLATION REGULATORY FACTOR 3-like [Hibiscus syriacus]|uniref:MA3 DOMAIN-CONTAINING TRANSLATION REGULATORY FACTOR 3-like n=1 Tax=Hibiscus syriacus TaxID=106335 RepID=UPI001923E004|nr:MA3 DOMAIN-CONTAINING TRANSLATION REGULATORY FACTOR 3-like [Hibiscus syriacus]